MVNYFILTFVILVGIAILYFGWKKQEKKDAEIVAAKKNLLINTELSEL